MAEKLYCKLCRMIFHSTNSHIETFNIRKQSINPLNNIILVSVIAFRLVCLLIQFTTKKYKQRIVLDQHGEDESDEDVR